ncbi:MAG: hypothetical protein GY711_19205 [bacterium]|nr:hypothetical protein [bacterium]
MFTDRDGNFTFPGVNTPLNITSRYFGTFNDVNNSAGSDYAITFQNVQPNQPNTLLMNPAPNELITAQANGYLHIGSLRDFIRDTIPGDATADFRASSNVSLNGSCNAFYTGGSVNYYRSNLGCANMAFTTLIGHEFGHWLNDLYGTGNGSDGMGEGNADVFAMYAFDTPVVGEEYRTNGSFIRSADNTRFFCGDASPNCHGGVHSSGEAWMGAAWKVRRQLNDAHGGALGDATANGLFLGWMNAYNQSQIRSIIETQWLTLDDDDGNLSNGTPNFTEIDAGFREHGFPGVDVDFVDISNVTQIADTTDEAGPYVVFAGAVAQIAPVVTGAEIFYSVSGGPFDSVPMTAVGGDTFRGEIPGQTSPTTVRYYIAATDAAGDGNVFPRGAPRETLEFAVGVVTTFLSTQFEGPDNEGWTVGSAGDTAFDGLWVRGDPNGTLAQPEDDHTPGSGSTCWFTGQGTPGGSNNADDVDGGATSLVSPLFDATFLENAEIVYWRWFSASSDVFRVDLSNDGGQTWTEVESLGAGNATWVRASFRLLDYLPQTQTMRVRFVCADLTANELVEGAIDDVVGRDVRSVCAPPSQICATSPNSAGAGAQLFFIGSQSVSANDVSLFSFGAPQFQFGCSSTA